MVMMVGMVVVVVVVMEVTIVMVRTAMGTIE